MVEFNGISCSWGMWGGGGWAWAGGDRIANSPESIHGPLAFLQDQH